MLFTAFFSKTVLFQASLTVKRKTHFLKNPLQKLLHFKSTLLSKPEHYYKSILPEYFFGLNWKILSLHTLVTYIHLNRLLE